MTRALTVAILGGVCAYAAYAGWAHTRPTHPVDAQAEQIACEELSTCGSSSWSLDASPFERRYAFETSQGPVSVSCRWTWLLWGEVRCEGHRSPGPGVVPKAPERYPHEIGREAPSL